jgi:hypothetical protein
MRSSKKTLTQMYGRSSYNSDETLAFVGYVLGLPLIHASLYLLLVPGLDAYLAGDLAVSHLERSNAPRSRVPSTLLCRWCAAQAATTGRHTLQGR